MGLRNLLKVIVHHLLIERIIGFDYQDRFPCVYTSVYGYTLNMTYGESWLKAIK